MHPATLDELRMELFLRKRNNLSWTTKNGNVIPITKLTTKHIENIVSFLESFENDTTSDSYMDNNKQYFDERTDSLF